MRHLRALPAIESMEVSVSASSWCFHLIRTMHTPMRISRLRPVEEDSRVVIIVVASLKRQTRRPYCVVAYFAPPIAHRHAIVKTLDYRRLPCHL
jgi:hypothetical protein